MHCVFFFLISASFSFSLIGVQLIYFIVLFYFNFFGICILVELVCKTEFFSFNFIFVVGGGCVCL